jgi:transposase InsO family protein
MSHPNARLTLYGRQLIVQRVTEGWTQAQVADATGVSRATVAKWLRRFREHGEEGLVEGSSAAHSHPRQTPQPVVDEILSLRRTRALGPHRIAAELKLAASTVYAVLKRNGLSVLAALDKTTRKGIRFERERPGEMLHFDIKKLGRIPDGGGKRFDEGFAETGAGKARPGPKRGHVFAHVAIDDHSRYAFVELLPDEKGDTTAGFMRRAVDAFANVGVTVERILSDNGANYRSRVYAETAAELAIGLRFTKPRHPQTNGKAEAFIKTLQREWAYLRKYLSDADREAALASFLLDYNHSRPHTGIGNLPPATRIVSPVNNPPENNN